MGKGRNLGTFCCQDFDAEGDNAKERCCESDLEMIMPNTEGGRTKLSALLLKMDDKKREEFCSTPPPPPPPQPPPPLQPLPPHSPLPPQQQMLSPRPKTSEGRWKSSRTRSRSRWTASALATRSASGQFLF